MDVEGLKQAFGVGVCCFITDDEATGNLAITEPTGEQIKNFVLTGGQPWTAQIRQHAAPQGRAAVAVPSENGHHSSLKWLLIVNEISLGHNGLQPWCIHAFGRNRIAKGQDHSMKAGVALTGSLDQIKTIATLQIIRADQQLVWIASFSSQIVETCVLIGHRTGDPGISPEGSAKGSEHEAAFGCHRDTTSNLDRFQSLVLGALLGCGQEGREVHDPAVDLMGPPDRASILRVGWHGLRWQACADDHQGHHWESPSSAAPVSC